MISGVRSMKSKSRATLARIVTLSALPGALALLLWCVPAPSLQPQSPAPQPALDRISIDPWIPEGPREEIRWRKRLYKPALSLHQRLLTVLEIKVPVKELAKRRDAGRLVAILQVTDSKGRVYREDDDLDLQMVNPKARKAEIVFMWRAFMLPGDYTLAMALYDTATRERSFEQRSLRVEAMKSDPLPEAWKDLPTVEFLESPPGPEGYFHPELKGRLHLPLQSKRPVRIELLFNLTPSERKTRSASAYNQNLSVLLPILKTFAGIETQNGAVDVATLDLMHHRVGFEQNNVTDLDWVRLKLALKAADSGIVDVDALRQRKENAAFLKKELERRTKSADDREVRNGLRVIVLVSSPMAFESGASLRAAAVQAKCDCRFYYVRCERVLRSADFETGQIWMGTALDEIEGIVKPFKPRVFAVESPEAVRKALAAILSEVSQMSEAN